MAEGVSALDERAVRVEDGLSSVDGRLARVEDRLASVEDRTTGVQDRMTTLEENMERGFEEVKAMTAKRICWPGTCSSSPRGTTTSIPPT